LSSSLLVNREFYLVYQFELDLKTLKKEQKKNKTKVLKCDNLKIYTSEIIQ